MIHALGTAGLYLGALAAWAFCVAYRFSARWRKSAEGWHLMTFTGTFAAILTYLSWRSLHASARPVSTGDDIARAVIYCSVAALMVWRFWLLGRRQIWASWRRRSKKGS